jgi:hypothetical protein
MKQFTDYGLRCSIALVILRALFISQVFAQARVTTVGIQLKPIFPVDFLGTGSQSEVQNTVHFDLALKSGFSGGMFIRRGITDLIAIEGGINYVKRTYNFKISEGSYSASSGFRMIGYEIPLSALIYIRLGEQLYMNVSMGASADMYASNVSVFDDYYRVYTVRKNTFQPAVIANVGWEYRTEKSGAFYIGSSFHRPFSYEFVTRIDYKKPPVDETFYNSIGGSYLTVDFRYFFHEDAQKKK